MHAYAIDPKGTRTAQVYEICKSIGALTSDGKVRTCGKNSDEWQAVRSVFPRILRAAREEHASLMQAAEQAGDDEAIGRLRRAGVQLEAWQDDGFVVLDVNTPNAFVHSLVPRLIFVHRGLFWTDVLAEPEGLSEGMEVMRQDRRGNPSKAKVVAIGEGDSPVTIFADGKTEEVSQEELFVLARQPGVIKSPEHLAMLLGHELSHVMHEHFETKTALLRMDVACQLVLFSLLDPTGLSSALAELGMYLIGTFGLMLPNSRENEHEADDSGLKIVARAMYDPRDAVGFFSNMLAMEDEHVPQWASTHPGTENRLQRVQEAAQETMHLFEQAQRAAEEAAEQAKRAARQAAGLTPSWSWMRRAL